ncbi:MAG: DUF2868 domain-containing protein [Ottowia sp.]|nr:DUF2868 domain-containing protein [Ottowia sp.]
MAASRPFSPLPATAPGRLAAAVLGSALRRIEASGPLDDQALLVRAAAAGGSRAGQIRQRNAWLGERLGMRQELARWRQLGLLLVLVLAVLMALAGLAAARSVLAPDRGINAVAAVVGVLVLPTLTLLAWLVALLAGGRSTGSGDWSFGRLLLSLAARMPSGRGVHRPELLQALLEVMQRQRLWPWFSGLVSHAVWLLALLLTLLLLIFGFSFQAYRLSWETTILSTAFFQQFVALSGWLPQLLGFPVPDAAAVMQVGQAASVADPLSQRAWAWWVIGCISIYGLLPRALLLVLSGWRWRAGMRRIVAVDMSDPYNQRLARRLDALAPASQVVDPEHAHAHVPAAGARAGAGTAAGTLATIGFELPDELPWPAPGLDAAFADLLRVDGSAGDVRQALQQLAVAPPAAVLVVLHAPASPDRGTARFLRDVAALVARCAVLLVGPDSGAADAGSAERWRNWLQAQGLSHVALLPHMAEAARWLESDRA